MKRPARSKLTAADIEKHRSRGLTLLEIAKLAGCSLATVNRRMADLRMAPEPTMPAEASAIAPALSDAAGRRARAIEALERSMAGDNLAAANAAAKILIEEERRAESASLWADANSRAARAWTRARAAELGRALRAAAESDPDLHAVYVAAARAGATDDEREALAVLIETRYPALCEDPCAS